MIKVLYFSPTGNTLRALQALVEALPQQPAEWHSCNTPAEREALPAFAPDDILVWGSPVYAGKLPNKLTPWLRENLHGCGNPAVLLCTFGNRSFDNALAEMQAIAEEGGFRPVAAAALAAQHAFDGSIGEGRPAAEDLAELRRWGAQISFDSKKGLLLPGSAAAPYYQPLREDMQPAVFLKAVPQIDKDRCTRCGECARRCPMGSIALMPEDFPACQGICIKCMACVHHCPQKAIDIFHPDLQSHIRMLQQHCRKPQKNEFFLAKV